MARYVFQYFKQSPNVGDRVATPGRWFDFGDAVMQRFGQTAPPCDVAILGGGQAWQQVVDAVLAHTPDARHRVAWGIGLRSVRRDTVQFDIMSASLTLIGCRDVDIPGTTYVPCASCMAPRFRRLADPRHEVVFYTHGTRSEGVERPGGIPTLSNHEGSFPEVLDFLASGATVVTNSYHGTYWAMLMGRKVLCLPYSDKFRGFARMPVLADPGDWRAALPTARAVPEYLEECRAANRSFYRRVIALTQDSGGTP